MRKLFILLLAALAAIVFAPPASAQLNWAHQFVYVVPSLSQSNILVSFEGDGAPRQDYIDEGECAGEIGSLSNVASVCNTVSNSLREPVNVWTNPHWCSGVRYVVYNSGTYTYGAWHYFSGGSAGLSVNVDNQAYDAGSSATNPNYNYIRTEIYLVPNGSAGCVA